MTANDMTKENSTGKETMSEKAQQEVDAPSEEAQETRIPEGYVSVREMESLMRKFDAHKRLVSLLKERVDSANVLLESEKKAANEHSESVLNARESEISKLRYQVAQNRIEKSELEFISKSLRVELEEECSRKEKTNELIENLQNDVFSLKYELETVTKKQEDLEGNADGERESLTQVNEELTEALDTAKSDYQKLLKKLKAVESDRTRYRQERNKYRDDAHKRKSETERKIRQLEEKLLQTKQERDDMKAHLMESLSNSLIDQDSNNSLGGNGRKEKMQKRSRYSEESEESLSEHEVQKRPLKRRDANRVQPHKENRKPTAIAKRKVNSRRLRA